MTQTCFPLPSASPNTSSCWLQGFLHFTLSSFITGKQPAHAVCLQAAARRVVWAECRESHQSCPPPKLNESNLRIVYPIHLPLQFLIPSSWKGHQHSRKMKAVLIALGEQVINLRINNCNYFRGNNPYLQTFLRSLLSNVGGRKVRYWELIQKVTTEFLCAAALLLALSCQIIKDVHQVTSWIWWSLWGLYTKWLGLSSICTDSTRIYFNWLCILYENCSKSQNSHILHRFPAFQHQISKNMTTAAFKQINSNPLSFSI